jgi:hypothetical protein
MRYLAVPEMPRRHFWESFRYRARMAEWHAVADCSPQPVEALCGFLYASEAHRTWDQTLHDAQCPRCQRLVAGEEGPELDALGNAEVAPQEPVKAELLRRRVLEGA